MSVQSQPVELEGQLSTLSILQSVYCMEGEFVTPQETTFLIDAYSSGEDLGELPVPCALQATLSISLEDAASSRMIGLHISWSTDKPADTSTATPAPAPKLHLLKPDWLTRKSFESLSTSFDQQLAELPDGEFEDEVSLVASAVEAAQVLSAGVLAKQDADGEEQLDAGSGSDTLVRIWMHLPSLSTKSKRNDLVTYAPSYSITGIVHAGKPGLLILEAPTASAVEAYLSDIKTYSWADIPSSHKKISERLREEGLTSKDRAFKEMSEITEEINVNGMKGVRSNRGDLGVLRDWLTAKGLGGDRLANVLGTNLNGL